MASLSDILDSKAVVSAVSALVGGLLWNYVLWSRGRVRTLDYAVSHDRVGISAADTVLGDIALTWGGTPVANLFLTTVTLENNTSANLTDLRFRTFTGEGTILLNERSEFVGSTFSPKYTTEYNALITIPEAGEPTQEQRELWWHSREYHLAVLNRNQRVIFRYLTTAPQSGTGPWVWADMQHPGVRVAYQADGARVHGVLVKHAIWIGLGASALVLAGVIWSAIPAWAAASVCLVVGLYGQVIGAALYRLGRFIYRVIFH